MTKRRPSGISISVARPRDALDLTQTQVRSFRDDSVRFGGATAATAGGPPGYDSTAWQLKMMKIGHYFTIRLDGRIVGGMIAFRQAEDAYNLGRIWLEPEAQNRGIGRAAIEFLHAAFPQARKWTLETPAWAVRNHHLYEAQGYRKVGEQPCPDGFSELLYERVTREHAASGAGE